MGHIRNYYMCNCCGKWFHKSRGQVKVDGEFDFCSGSCAGQAEYEARLEADVGGGFEAHHWIEDESFRNEKAKFIPISCALVESICKEFGLVQDNMFDYNDEKERDYRGAFAKLGSDEIFWSYKEFGIDQASANFWPVVTIYKSDKGRMAFELHEKPYFVHEPASGRSDGKDCDYIEPGGKIHSVRSVARFRKYLAESIHDFVAVRSEYEKFTGRKYPVGDKRDYGF